ncbi:MAG: hypothetical protein HZC03_01140 [Candidatus Lloydbacteria bacterium]|nr:hypothetical protein [Candidatus Lloydbacteria bacterium]
MRKITFAVLFIGFLLFSGCTGIQGVGTSMKMDGTEHFFSIGNGPAYRFNIAITNALPGTMMHVLATRNGRTTDVAQLRPGESYTEMLASSMCYGSSNGYSSYSYWWGKPPETLYKVNVYKIVGSDKKNAQTEFAGTISNKFTMFDCQNQPMNYSVSWDVGGYWGSGGLVLR